MNKKSIIIISIELLILLVLTIILNTNLINYMPQCWIYQTTGILCPGCGGTRCIVNLFQGNIKEAFFSHMVFFITIIYLLICNIVLNKKKKIATWIYPKYWYSIIFVIILIIYTIIRNIL